MPWNNQGNNNGGPWGGGPSGGGPWGQGPDGNRPGGRQTPPEFEKMMQDARRNFGRMVPGGGKPGRLIIIGLLILLALWLFTGFYRVNPQQQGVVLRFGEWVKTTGPGLHFHIPYPIEQVITPEVTRDNRLEVGFRDNLRGSSSRRDIVDESLMITGDENIVDIDFVVFWRIADAGAYLFNLADPDGTIKIASAAAGVTFEAAVTVSDEGRSSETVGAIDISTEDGANAAKAVLQDAISQVNETRSELGAIQNRLDHTINNLGNVVVNTEASQSRIEDADFATETSALTKSQILSQAATAMLAQANASKQSVLSLLQG